jgi:hypothetical protein
MDAPRRESPLMLFFYMQRKSEREREREKEREREREIGVDRIAFASLLLLLQPIAP